MKEVEQLNLPGMERFNIGVQRKKKPTKRPPTGKHRFTPQITRRGIPKIDGKSLSAGERED